MIRTIHLLIVAIMLAVIQTAQCTSINQIFHEGHPLTFEYQPSQVFSDKLLASMGMTSEQFLFGHSKPDKNITVSLTKINNRWQGLLLIKEQVFIVSENSQAVLVTQKPDENVNLTDFSLDEMIIPNRSELNKANVLNDQSIKVDGDDLRVLRVEIVTDGQYNNSYGQTVSNERVMSMVNSAAMVFQEQVNMQLVVEKMTNFTEQNNPFSSQTNGDELLSELIQLKTSQTITVTQEKNMLLLITGKTLFFNNRFIGGFANGDSMCQNDSSAVISDGENRTLIQSTQTFIHEIGHVIGSRHDGQGNNACPNLGFIMSATPFFTDPILPTMFSECSLDAFDSLIETQGSCLFDSGFSIQAGLSGAWANLDTLGQGLMLDVMEESQQIFLAWFTFDRQAMNNNASFGSSQHRWFTAQGSYSGSTATIDLYQTTGGVFNMNTDVDTEAVGSFTISFDNCTSGEVEFTFDLIDVSTSFPINRLTPNVFCEESEQ